MIITQLKTNYYYIDEHFVRIEEELKLRYLQLSNTFNHISSSFSVNIRCEESSDIEKTDFHTLQDALRETVKHLSSHRCAE